MPVTVGDIEYMNISGSDYAIRDKSAQDHLNTVDSSVSTLTQTTNRLSDDLSDAETDISTIKTNFNNYYKKAQCDSRYASTVIEHLEGTEIVTDIISEFAHDITCKITGSANPGSVTVTQTNGTVTHTFTPDAEGNVTGMKNIAPPMTVSTNSEDTVISIDFIADTKKYLEKYTPKEVILWENPDLSASYASNTVDLAYPNAYDVKVVFRSSTATNAIELKQPCRRGRYSNVYYISDGGDKKGTMDVCSRAFVVSAANETATFSTAYQKTFTTTGTGTANNAKLIPAAIYGFIGGK